MPYGRSRSRSRSVVINETKGDEYEAINISNSRFKPWRLLDDYDLGLTKIIHQQSEFKQGDDDRRVVHFTSHNVCKRAAVFKCLSPTAVLKTYERHVRSLEIVSGVNMRD